MPANAGLLRYDPYELFKVFNGDRSTEQPVFTILYLMEIGNHNFFDVPT
jgi:hypothetical protein